MPRSALGGDNPSAAVAREIVDEAGEQAARASRSADELARDAREVAQRAADEARGAADDRVLQAVDTARDAAGTRTTAAPALDDVAPAVERATRVDADAIRARAEQAVAERTDGLREQAGQRVAERVRAAEQRAAERATDVTPRGTGNEPGVDQRLDRGATAADRGSEPAGAVEPFADAIENLVTHRSEANRPTEESPPAGTARVSEGLGDAVRHGAGQWVVDAARGGVAGQPGEQVVEWALRAGDGAVERALDRPGGTAPGQRGLDHAVPGDPAEIRTAVEHRYAAAVAQAREQVEQALRQRADRSGEAISPSSAPTGTAHPGPIADTGRLADAGSVHRAGGVQDPASGPALRALPELPERSTADGPTATEARGAVRSALTSALPFTAPRTVLDAVEPMVERALHDGRHGAEPARELAERLRSSGNDRPAQLWQEYGIERWLPGVAGRLTRYLTDVGQAAVQSGRLPEPGLPGTGANGADTGWDVARGGWDRAGAGWEPRTAPPAHDGGPEPGTEGMPGAEAGQDGRESGSGAWSVHRPHGWDPARAAGTEERDGRNPERFHDATAGDAPIAWSATPRDRDGTAPSGAEVVERARSIAGAVVDRTGDLAEAGGMPHADAVVRLVGEAVDAGLRLAQQALEHQPSGDPGRAAPTAPGSGLPPGALPARSDERAAAEHPDTGDGDGYQPGTDLLAAPPHGRAGVDCAGGPAGCGYRADPDRWERSSVSERGPPVSRYGIHQDEDGNHRFHDDSPERTEAVLEGRIEAEQGRADLAELRSDVRAGKATRAEYTKRRTEQQQLEESVEQDASGLSPERVEQIDDVIDGHRELERDSARLDAQRAKAEAGTLDEDTVAEREAAHAERAREVYDDTDRLAEATGHDTAVRAEGETAAGCTTSGVFAACGARAPGDRSDTTTGSAAADPGTDRATAGTEDDRRPAWAGDTTTEQDDCRALKGVSSCGVSVGSGDDRAAASCTLTGTDPRCATDAGTKSERDAASSINPGGRSGSDDSSASAACDLAEGDCRLSSATDDGGARADCAGPGCDVTAETGRTRIGAVPAGAKAADADRRAAGAEAAAHCAGPGCATTVEATPGRGDEPARAGATVDCGRSEDCTGDATVDSDGDTRAGTPGSESVRAAGDTATAGDAPETTEDATGGAAVTGAAAHRAVARGADTAGTAADGPATSGAPQAAAAAAGTDPVDRSAVTSGHAECTVTGGGCDAVTASRTSDPTGEGVPALFRSGAGQGGEAEGRSQARATVDCAGRTGCTGTGEIATRASGSVVSGDEEPVERATTGAGDCTAEQGRCTSTGSADSATPQTGPDTPSGVVAATGRSTGPDTVGRALSTVDCGGDPDCTGTGSTRTAGSGSGDPVADAGSGRTTAGERTRSTGSAGCDTTGGDCTSRSESSTAAPAASDAWSGAQATPTGPVSDSRASGNVECAPGSPACAGSVRSAASGADDAVDDGRARTSTGSAECRVTDGGCGATTSSAASSGPGAVLPGEEPAAAGPSAVSTASGRVDCAAGTRCSGAATSTATSHDPASGAPRTSSGQASCTAGGGSCSPQTVSVASTGSGAARSLSGDTAATERAAATGPSAASAAGAALECGDDGCDGRVDSTASGTDPSVSADPRGSHGSGACDGVSDACRAVTNSGASAGPDASVIAPLVEGWSTGSASVRSGTHGDATSGGPGSGGTDTGDGEPAGRDDPTDQQPALPPGGSPGAAAKVAPSVPGASAWSNVSAVLDCEGGPGGCTGAVGTSAEGTDGPDVVGEAFGARGPPEGGSSSTSRCHGEDSACAGVSTSSAGSGQVVADVVALQRTTLAEHAEDRAEQTERQAGEAERAAQQARATVDGTTGADPQARAAATERAAAADEAAEQARAVADQASDDADTARAAADEPVTDAPAGWSTSQASGRCGGPGCTVVTTGTSRADLDPADTHDPAATSRSLARSGCTAGPAGCATEAGATTTLELPAADDGAVARSASTAADAAVDCPDAACRGTVTTGTEAGATADAGSGDGVPALIDHARAATDRADAVSTGDTSTGDASTGDTSTGDAAAGADAAAGSPGSAPSSVSLADGTAGCAGRTEGCRAAAGTEGGITTVTGTGPAVTTTAAATADCAAGGADCPSRSRSVAVATDDPSGTAGSGALTSALADALDERTVPGRDGVAHGVGAAECTTPGCSAGSGGFAGADTAEVSAHCTGADCTTRTAARAVHGAHSARSQTGCTAGPDGTCAGASRAGASAAGAEVSASCEGDDCTHRWSATSSDSAAAAGNSARADARCGASGGSGSGWCATSAVAEATGDVATAAAACEGSAGSGCRHSYSASSSAASGAASASADGHGGGTTGSGQVTTTAAAESGPGYAAASAACTGSSGTTCRHSYSASASASAAYGANSASASASGSGGGGHGGGGVSVSAQADAGPGSASASASCSGAANCTHSYSATASAAASHGANSASAHASGSGGGGQGGGGVSVSAQADAGPGSASASASCSGAANCTHSYSASASASASDGGSWAEAHASGSGGGGQGGGGVSVTAHAAAGPGWAEAGASCSGAANCTSSYTAHAEASDSVETAPTWEDPGGRWDAHGEGTCSGTGNGSCGVAAYAQAGPGGGGGATCWGDCANFTQSGSNDFTVTSPSLSELAAQQEEAAAGDGDEPTPVEEMGEEDRGIEGRLDEDGNPVLSVKSSDEDPISETCADGCPDGLDLRTDDGERISYDPGTGFEGALPVEPGSEREDRVRGTDGAGISRDREGNGSGWVRGHGEFTDGHSGETVRFRPTAEQQQARPTSTFRPTGPEGSPVQISCGGACEYHGPTRGGGAEAGGEQGRDRLVANGDWAEITGRDGAGNPARITFQGEGTFTSAEGDVVHADGVSHRPDLAVSSITTRGADGSAGRYGTGRGDTGYIELREGYRVEQDQRSWVHTFSDEEKLLGGTPDHMVVGGANQLTVTTPDGAGNEGSAECTGRCTLTRPDWAQARVQDCPNCTFTEPVIGEAQVPENPGTVTFWGDQDELQHWTDPWGNRAECRAGTTGCDIGMRYGPGGGTVCEGPDCRSTNAAGQSVTGSGYLLHPDEDGANTGFGCKAGPNECTASGGLDDLGWEGEPTAAWMIGIDPDFTRPAQDTEIDRELAEHLGLEEGDPLPPLDDQALADLYEQDRAAYDAYQDALPELTARDRTNAVLTVGSSLSILHDRADRMEEQLPGLEDAVAAQRAANEGGLTAAEERELAPHLELIEEAAETDAEFARARTVVDSVRGQGHPTAEQQEAFADVPGLPGSAEGLREMGADESGDPAGAGLSAADRAALDGARIAELSTVPRASEVDRRHAAHEQRVAELGPGATPTERVALERERGWINGEIEALEGIEGRVGATRKDLAPAGDGRDRRERMREFDIAAAEGVGDTALADRLRTWNDLQVDAERLAEDMEGSGDPRQERLSGTYSTLAEGIGLTYDTTAKDRAWRSPDTVLRDTDVQLPSTGRTDVFLAVKSAEGKQAVDALTDDERDQLDRLAEKEGFGDDTGDRLAAAAAYWDPQDRLREEFAERKVDLDKVDSADARKRIRELGGDDGVVEELGVGFSDENGSGRMPIYRIEDDDGEVRYVDPNGHDYSGLGDFRDNNELFGEDTRIVTAEDWGDAAGDFALTSTNGRHYDWWDRNKGYVYLAPTVAGLAAVTFTPGGQPIAAAGWATLAATTTVAVGEEIGNLRGRYVRGQSLDPIESRAARNSWVTIGGGLVSGGAGTAFLRSSALARSALTPATSTTSAAAAAQQARAATSALRYQTAGRAMNGTALAGFGAHTVDHGVQLYRDWDSLSSGQRARGLNDLALSTTMLGLPAGMAKVHGMTERGAAANSVRHQHQAQLRHTARHGPLTGVPRSPAGPLAPARGPRPDGELRTARVVDRRTGEDFGTITVPASPRGAQQPPGPGNTGPARTGNTAGVPARGSRTAGAPPRVTVREVEHPTAPALRERLGQLEVRAGELRTRLDESARPAPRPEADTAGTRESRKGLDAAIERAHQARNDARAGEARQELAGVRAEQRAIKDELDLVQGPAGLRHIDGLPVPGRDPATGSHGPTAAANRAPSGAMAGARPGAAPPTATTTGPKSAPGRPAFSRARQVVAGAAAGLMVSGGLTAAPAPPAASARVAPKSTAVDTVAAQTTARTTPTTAAGRPGTAGAPATVRAVPVRSTTGTVPASARTRAEAVPAPGPGRSASAWPDGSAAAAGRAGPAPGHRHVVVTPAASAVPGPGARGPDPEPRSTDPEAPRPGPGQLPPTLTVPYFDIRVAWAYGWMRGNAWHAPVPTGHRGLHPAGVSAARYGLMESLAQVRHLRRDGDGFRVPVVGPMAQRWVDGRWADARERAGTSILLARQRVAAEAAERRYQELVGRVAGLPGASARPAGTVGERAAHLAEWAAELDRRFRETAAATAAVRRHHAVPPAQREPGRNPRISSRAAALQAEAELSELRHRRDLVRAAAEAAQERARIPELPRLGSVTARTPAEASAALRVLGVVNSLWRSAADPAVPPASVVDLLHRLDGAARAPERRSMTGLHRDIRRLVVAARTGREQQAIEAVRERAARAGHAWEPDTAASAVRAWRELDRATVRRMGVAARDDHRGVVAGRAALDRARSWWRAGDGAAVTPETPLPGAGLAAEQQRSGAPATRGTIAGRPAGASAATPATGGARAPPAAPGTRRGVSSAAAQRFGTARQAIGRALHAHRVPGALRAGGEQVSSWRRYAVQEFERRAAEHVLTARQDALAARLAPRRAEIARLTGGLAAGTRIAALARETGLRPGQVRALGAGRATVTSEVRPAAFRVELGRFVERAVARLPEYDALRADRAAAALAREGRDAAAGELRARRAAASAPVRVLLRAAGATAHPAAAVAWWTSAAADRVRRGGSAERGSGPAHRERQLRWTGGIAGAGAVPAAAMVGAGWTEAGLTAGTLVLSGAAVRVRHLLRGSRQERAPPRWVTALSTGALFGAAPAAFAVAGVVSGGLAAAATALPRLLAVPAQALVVYRITLQWRSMMRAGGVEGSAYGHARRSAARAALVSGLGVFGLNVLFPPGAANGMWYYVAATLVPTAVTAVQTRWAGWIRVSDIVLAPFVVLPALWLANGVVALFGTGESGSATAWFAGAAVTAAFGLLSGPPLVWLLDRGTERLGPLTARRLGSVHDAAGQVRAWWHRLGIRSLYGADVGNEFRKLDGPLFMAAVYAATRPWAAGETWAEQLPRGAAVIAVVLGVNVVRDALNYNYGDGRTQPVRRVRADRPARPGLADRLRAVTPGPWRGRAAQARLAAAITEHLSVLGLPGGTRDEMVRGLADDLAAGLAPLPARTAEARPTAAERADRAVARAWRTERRLAERRERQQARTVLASLPVLREHLSRMRPGTSPERAATVAILVEALRVVDAGRNGVTPGPAAAARFRAELEQRDRLRAEHARARIRVLEALLERHTHGRDPRRRGELETALENARGRAERERARTVDPDPLHSAVRLWRDRARAIGDGRARGTAADDGRLARADAAMTLLRWAGDVVRARRHDGPERRHDAGVLAARLAPVADGPVRPAAVPELGVLVNLAGARRGATPASYAARFGGDAAAAGRLLTDMAARGLLVVGSDGGYRARPELRTWWRKAPPVLRAALRTDPAAVPGAAGLDLLGDPAVRVPRPVAARGGWAALPAAERGHRVLVELVRGAALTGRFPVDGARNVLWQAPVRAGRLPAGLRGPGAVDTPAATGGVPASVRTGERTGEPAPAPPTATELVAGLRAAAATASAAQGRADRARARVQAERRRAGAGGPRAPPADPAVRTWIDLLDRQAEQAVDAAVEAMVVLAETLAGARADAARLAGAGERRAEVRLHRLHRAADTAEAVLARRTGAPPVPVAIRDAVLNAIRVAELAVEGLTAGVSRDRVRAAVAAERELLEVRRRAQDARYRQTLGGVRHLVRAIELGDRLAELLHDAGAAAGVPSVAPRVQAGPLPAATHATPAPAGAGQVVAEVSGQGTAVLARGLRPGRLPVRSAVSAAYRALTGGGDTRAAVRAAAGTVLGRPDSRGEVPVVLAAAQVRPHAGTTRVTISWAGDVSAHWVPQRGAAFALLGAELRSGVLTGWLGTGRSAGPVRTVTHEVRGPGTLVLFTGPAAAGADGRHPAASVVHGDPARTVAALTAAAHAAGHRGSGAAAVAVPAPGGPAAVAPSGHHVSAERPTA